MRRLPGYSASMKALQITERIVFPAVAFVAAYVRDLGDGDGADRARETASTVELRVDLSLCEGLSEAECSRLQAFPPLRADRRGILRVSFGENNSRTSNLRGAREVLVMMVRDGLGYDPDYEEPEPEPNTPSHRKGSGLNKARRRRS